MADSAQPAKKNILKQVIGVAFAVFFLWLAFRGSDPRQLFNYFIQIQPWFLFLVCVSGLCSHFLRAVRWLILLRPLSDHKISLWNSFCAVMVGYAVNVVLPRGGEVARLVSISRSEKLPWAGVLSTMFIDRLLDFALLVFILGFTLAVFPNNATSTLPWLVPGGVGLSVVTIIGLLALPQMAAVMKWLTNVQLVKNRLPAAWFDAIQQLSDQFDLGTKSLRDPLSYPAIAGLSICMWFFYWLNFCFMIYAFKLEHQVSMVQTLIVFTIGSVGVLIPTPGSVGSFHFLVSQSLQMVAGVNHNLALAFASILHLVSFVVITCIPAAICVAIQSMQAGKLKKRTQDFEQQQTDPAQAL